MKLELIIISIIFLFKKTYQTLLLIQNSKKRYCFTKEIVEEEDYIEVSYIISSSKKESIFVILTKKKENKILFQQDRKQSGNYKSEVLELGIYELCFYPNTKSDFYLSFEFYSYQETGVIKDLAIDKEFKNMSLGVQQLKLAINEFDKNLGFLTDRRSRHHIILTNMIDSIKKLSYIKIIILVLLSLFQIFIIQRFFGKDKRVTKLPGAFSGEKL
jgi:hypothetical protein